MNVSSRKHVPAERHPEIKLRVLKSQLCVVSVLDVVVIMVNSGDPLDTDCTQEYRRRYSWNLKPLSNVSAN